MYQLKRETKVAAISALTEGASIRSVERMTGAHRDTIMRLMVRVGTACRSLLDDSLRNLPWKRVELEEQWTFVGKKQRRLSKARWMTRAAWATSGSGTRSTPRARP